MPCLSLLLLFKVNSCSLQVADSDRDWVFNFTKEVTQRCLQRDFDTLFSPLAAKEGRLLKYSLKDKQIEEYNCQHCDRFEFQCF